MLNQMWQTRDLNLFGRTMLVKALGISKLVYAASLSPLLVTKILCGIVKRQILLAYYQWRFCRCGLDKDPA